MISCQLFWIQLILQSNGLALIAISYRFKVRNYNNSSSFEPNLEINDSRYGLPPYPARFQVFTAENALTNCLFILLILIPFVVPAFDLMLKPYFDYAGLADLAFIMTIFNMIFLA